MPMKLAAPLEKEFTLERTDEEFGTDGTPTIIKIRQASQEQNEIRGAVLSGYMQTLTNDGLADELKLEQKWTYEQLKRTEVFLTMVDCNLMDEEGKQLFHFRSEGKNGKQILDMNTEAFRKAFGKLPPQVAAEIHEKVRLVNITWANPLST